MAKKPIRVSQLNAYIARVLQSDAALSDVCVRGEVTGARRHDSGHMYFGLKDGASRVSCFLPSAILARLGFDMHDGLAVVCEGYVSVYEKGGTYSLGIRRIEPEGQGALSLSFEALKARLEAKGYFDAGRKRPLPRFPKSVAVVTSNTGAAVEDILKIIAARNKAVTVRVFPTLVQGEAAGAMIAARIREVGEAFPETDVMIVGRGGGSAEDLWAFNDEAVADAIYASPVPVISAVGHETDFTISDFVADRRAETPTAAAQLAVPDTDELEQDLCALRSAMASAMSRRLAIAEYRVKAHDMDGLRARLSGRVRVQGAGADMLAMRMGEAVAEALRKGSERVRAHDMDGLRARLSERARAQAAAADILAARMGGAVAEALRKGQERAARCALLLEAQNPLNVMKRGFAVVYGADGAVVRGAGALAAGDDVALRFADGSREARVL